MTTVPRYVSKVLLLGDSFVGKSCLIQRYVKKEFLQEFRATIGCDFLLKQIVTPTNENVTLQIWDTAGQERFQSLGHTFYRGSDGLALVFDITNPESFAHLESWIDSFLDHSGILDPNFPIILVGNKSDRANERRVSEGDVREWLARHPRIRYFECSAKDGTGIDAAFMELCMEIRSKDTRSPTVLDKGIVRIQRTQGKTGKKLGNCCKK